MSNLNKTIEVCEDLVSHIGMGDSDPKNDYLWKVLIDVIEDLKEDVKKEEKIA